MAAAGDKIRGFTLVRQLGTGGMGETWEAVRQVGPDFEQRVAIKVVTRSALERPEGLSLFRREASLAASLRHPNIASVLDVDEQLGAIVCELVEGADLRAVLRASLGLRLSAPLLVYVVGQIARGLSHAHRRVLHGQLSPVVHRDMSPGNVVADYDGNLKIVDFGIAKAIASADISETIKGKLSYMAPEQAMGTRIDGRADQYALGVMAYEAASGTRPNDGLHDGETLAKILSGKRVPLATCAHALPESLIEIIERMLAVNPDQRFASMDAVIEALDPFTPPLSIHRDLAQLVLRARPARTIVKHNGQYISQPVSGESLRREPTPSRGTPPRSSVPVFQPGSRNPVNPHAATEAFRPAGLPPHTDTLVSPNVVPVRPATMHDEFSLAVPASRVRSRQATLAIASALGLALVSWAVLRDSTGSEQAPTVVSPATVSAGPEMQARAESARAIPTAVVSSSAPAQSPLTAADPKPAAAPTPSPIDPPARRGPRSSDGEVDSSRRVSRESKRTSKEREPSGARVQAGASAPKPAKSASATVRVKVFPWGRVWVDGNLQGSVPPILEVALSAGSHEIAVGHERPIETRSVTVESGATQLVSFDLEGR